MSELSLFLGTAILTLLWMTGTPIQLHAQHHHFGSQRGFHSGFHPGAGAFSRSSFHRGFHPGFHSSRFGTFGHPGRHR